MTEHGAGKRTSQFKRNFSLDEYLKRLNKLFWNAEKKILMQYSEPQLPIVLIIGAPRSGTTLLLQWLSQSGCFSYPSNFISRFYGAPASGAMIQKMFTEPELNYRNELTNGQDALISSAEGSNKFISNLGKTTGMLAPNEFWFFWRRFFSGNLKRIDKAEFNIRERMAVLKKELAAFESILKMPLMMKGMMFNWNLKDILRLFPKTVFIYIKRELFYNAQSLLKTRKKYFNNQKEWYSFKPSQYPNLKYLSVYEQVAGQVYYTNLEIEKQLNIIKPANQLCISYEKFCGNPGIVWENMLCKLSGFGYKTSSLNNMKLHFDSTNRIILHKEEEAFLQAAGQKLSEKEG